MGATMAAIIEWTHESQSAIPGEARWGDDHLHGILFNTDKENDFFAAVAGVRNRFQKLPLIAMRGVPDNLSASASAHFKLSDATNAGWLHLSEIGRCMRHLGFDRADLGFELVFAMEMMEQLVAKLGDGNVRLVFDIFD